MYTNDKFLYLSTIKKIHLNCNVFDGSVVNGFRQTILFSFILDKPSRFKVFCLPETIHYKNVSKSVLNTIIFYLEDDNNEVVNSNGETLTYTLKLI